MSYPTPWTVVIIDSANFGDFDDYGNPIHVATRTDWPVYGWAPGGSQELTGWSSQVTADLAVYGPEPPVAISSTAQLEVDGLVYDVKGVPQDFDHGPFGFAPGVVVQCDRVTG